MPKTTDIPAPRLKDLVFVDHEGDWHCTRPSDFAQNHIRDWAEGTDTPREYFYGETEPVKFGDQINFLGFKGPIGLLQKRFVAYNNQVGRKVFRTDRMRGGRKKMSMEVRKNG